MTLYQMERDVAKVPFNYGIFESYAACWTIHEAWVLIENSWVQFNAGEVAANVRQLPEAEVRQTFGPLPSLPAEAFTHVF